MAKMTGDDGGGGRGSENPEFLMTSFVNAPLDLFGRMSSRLVFSSPYELKCVHWYFTTLLLIFCVVNFVFVSVKQVIDIYWKLWYTVRFCSM